MSTKWICSDPDCFQYTKKLSKYKYECVQIIHISYDEEEPLYLCYDIIDIEQYLKYDLRTLLNVLHSYGYTEKYFENFPTQKDFQNALNQLRFCYGKGVDLFQIIAECLFEVKPNFETKIFEGSEEACIKQLNLIISE